MTNSLFYLLCLEVIRFKAKRKKRLKFNLKKKKKGVKDNLYQLPHEKSPRFIGTKFS